MHSASFLANRAFPTIVLFIFSFSSLVNSVPRIPDDPPAPKLPSTIKLRNEFIKSTFPPIHSKKGRTGSTSPSSFLELQLNLCNSGWAKSCYSKGKSIPEGAGLIYDLAPNVVTVNEICLDDITKHLQPALGNAWPDDYTYSVMMPAIDKRTNKVYKCVNGDLYGDVVIGRVAKTNWKGFDAYGGMYVTQDPTSNEQRTFACAYATGDHFACTTHLAAQANGIALTQCKALLFDALPYLKAQSVAVGDTIVGGDLNLKYDKGGKDNVQRCVPNGYTRKGDGDVQHTTFSNDLKFVGSEKHGMSWTDHPYWLTELRRS